MKRVHAPSLPKRFDGAGVLGSGDDELDPQEEAAAQPVDSIIALAENHHHEVGIACLRMSDFSVEVRAHAARAARTLTHSPRPLRARAMN